MASDRATVSARILTIPNLLSFARLLMVPVFFALLVTGRDGWALIVLIVSSLSDFFDGLIARKFNQVSRLGQLLDPIADRLFILAALLGLVLRDIVPWWFAAIIIARDVMLIVLGIVLANHGYGPLPVHHLGKLGTACLFYALPIIMLGHAVPQLQFVTDPIGWAFAIWGAFLYWWGGVIYAAQTGRLVRKSRDTPLTASDTLDR
jgi:cardiolipin synthase (CMP-forming)